MWSPHGNLNPRLKLQFNIATKSKENDDDAMERYVLLT